MCLFELYLILSRFADWDDTKTIVRYVGKSEFDYWIRKKDEEVLRRREEEANKGKKKEAKKAVAEDKIPVFNKDEEQNIALEEVV